MPVSHIWNDSKPAPAHADPPIRVLAGARQPEDLDVPLVALYHGTVYGQLPTGAGLADLEVSLARGQITGIIEVVKPHCYRVYANGRCKYETVSAAVAAAELAEYTERRGFWYWLARWCDARAQARTTAVILDEMAAAAREVRV